MLQSHYSNIIIFNNEKQKTNMMKNNCRLVLIPLLLSSLMILKPCLAWSQASQADVSSRRNFVQQGLTTTGAATFLNTLTVASSPAAAAAETGSTTTIGSLMKDLKDSQEKLAPIPDLLEDKEWDKVRSILKVPPVNKLWNLGESQNPVLQLAKETGNVDLFEVKEDLAYNLQMCDQLTYDNAFVYFQPGNGKYKIKEPQELSKKAMAEIQQIMDMASSSSM